MRQALTLIVVATLACPLHGAAERKAWSQIRYIGGTVAIKTSRYDWNTVMTVNADEIVVEIAPATVFQSKKVVHIKVPQVLSLSSNEAAWQHVGAVDGAQLPSKPPTLFGVMLESYYIGLVYQTDDGKRAAMLLEAAFSPVILRVLNKLTGKPIENSP
jgi:hypothetical protein